MSDPIAVSILSKLTSWYDFEGNLNDAHGPYNLTGSVVAGYQAGKIGQCLKRGSRAIVNVTPTAITNTSGHFTVGFWAQYQSSVTGIYDAGLTSNTSVPANEALYIGNLASNRHFYVNGYTTDLVGGNSLSWEIQDPSPPTLRYPFTVQAVDINGRVATSPQQITISSPTGYPPGWYFAVATFDNGFVSLYINGILVASGNVLPRLKTPVVQFQIANQYVSSLSTSNLDSTFFSLTSAMTATEVSWLYNLNAGRSHAEIVSLAA